MKITLPIYYIQNFKNKESKKFLVGMNWYRNAHYHISNTVKQHYHQLIKKQLDLSDPIKIKGQFKLLIEVYYKSSVSDGSNISAIMEKFVLDAFQKEGIIVNDNVNYHLGTSWSIVTKNKENPHVEITIKEL
jgi:Holliday junction resolvase RusA-like endonuclease